MYACKLSWLALIFWLVGAIGAVRAQEAGPPLAAVTPSPFSNSQCSYTSIADLPNTVAATSNYILPRINAAIYAPPFGSIVYFQVLSATSRNPANTDFFPQLNQSHNLWWTVSPSFRRADPTGYTFPFINSFLPENIQTFSNSGKIQLIPILIKGNSVYCLQPKNYYKRPDLVVSSPFSGYDIIEEFWFGTASNSPVYAVVRIKWSPSDHLSCDFDVSLAEVGGKALRCIFSPLDRRRSPATYFGVIKDYNAARLGLKPPPSYGNLDWNVVAVSPKTSKLGAFTGDYTPLPEGTAITGDYTPLSPPQGNDGNVLKSTSLSISLQPVAAPLKQPPPEQPKSPPAGPPLAVYASELKLSPRFGTLRCDVSSGLQDDIKSGKEISCVFTSVSGTRPYHATIGKIAEVFGSADTGSFFWTVIPPTTAALPLPEGVGGKYTAPVAPPPTDGKIIKIIQTGVDPISLQPSPIQDDKSRQNLASGVSELTLTVAP
jgi:hypothetical protein